MRPSGVETKDVSAPPLTRALQTVNPVAPSTLNQTRPEALPRTLNHCPCPGANGSTCQRGVAFVAAGACVAATAARTATTVRRARARRAGSGGEDVAGNLRLVRMESSGR